jgi:hypothetical protein
VIRHVSSRDGGQSWSLPQDLPVRMDGSSDLVLKLTNPDAILATRASSAGGGQGRLGFP